MAPPRARRVAVTMAYSLTFLIILCSLQWCQKLDDVAMTTSLLHHQQTLASNAADKVVSSTPSPVVSSFPRLLVAQHGAAGEAYERLLSWTWPLNELYAARLPAADYHLLQKVPVTNRTLALRPSRSTYFKLFIVEYALLHNYDQLLMLDADAVVVDFDFDVRALLSSSAMTATTAHNSFPGNASNSAEPLVVAHQVQATLPNQEIQQSTDVNIGVTLWNLKHPAMIPTFRAWFDACAERMKQGLPDDDQKPLQQILTPTLTRGLRTEFAYGKGTVVKHFIRLNSRNWRDGEVD